MGKHHQSSSSYRITQIYVNFRRVCSKFRQILRKISAPDHVIDDLCRLKPFDDLSQPSSPADHHRPFLALNEEELETKLAKLMNSLEQLAREISANSTDPKYHWLSRATDLWTDFDLARRIEAAMREHLASTNRPKVDKWMMRTIATATADLGHENEKRDILMNQHCLSRSEESPAGGAVVEADESAPDGGDRTVSHYEIEILPEKTGQDAAKQSHQSFAEHNSCMMDRKASEMPPPPPAEAPLIRFDDSPPGDSHRPAIVPLIRFEDEPQPELAPHRPTMAQEQPQQLDSVSRPSCSTSSGADNLYNFRQLLFSSPLYSPHHQQQPQRTGRRIDLSTPKIFKPVSRVETHRPPNDDDERLGEINIADDLKDCHFRYASSSISQEVEFRRQQMLNRTGFDDDDGRNVDLDDISLSDEENAADPKRLNARLAHYLEHRFLAEKRLEIFAESLARFRAEHPNHRDQPPPLTDVLEAADGDDSVESKGSSGSSQEETPFLKPEDRQLKHSEKLTLDVTLRQLFPGDTAEDIMKRPLGRHVSGYFARFTAPLPGLNERTAYSSAVIDHAKMTFHLLLRKATRLVSVQYAHDEELQGILLDLFVLPLLPVDLLIKFDEQIADGTFRRRLEDLMYFLPMEDRMFGGENEEAMEAPPRRRPPPPPPPRTPPRPHNPPPTTITRGRPANFRPAFPRRASAAGGASSAGSVVSGRTWSKGTTLELRQRRTMATTKKAMMKPPCEYCAKVIADHGPNDCPQRPAAVAAAAAVAATNRPFCFLCFCMGHLAENCPNETTTDGAQRAAIAEDRFRRGRSSTRPPQTTPTTTTNASKEIADLLF